MIEIHELVIEARVSGPAAEARREAPRLQDLSPAEQEKLVDAVALRVLRVLREEKEL